MSRHSGTTPSRKAALVGAGMFLALLILTQLLCYFWYLSARQKEMQRLTNQANARRERIHITLSNSLSCIRTLAFLVEEQGVPQDFDRVAEKLLKVNPLVDAIELLEKGVITHVFPKSGNEAALGYDILSDTLRHSGALTAMRTRDFFFAGPVELKQGGVAIIGRQPIFIDNKFWGFSAVLIHLSNFIKTTGIDDDPSHDFIYQLARVHPADGSEEFFLHAADRDKGDFIPVEIPNTEWRLYVSSREQEELVPNAIAFSLLGLLVALIGGTFSYFLAAQPEKLNALVRQRTAQLTMEKELSDAIINSLPGIFYLYDEDRKFLRWNRNFEIVSRYSADEIRMMNPLDFFQGEDKKLLDQKIKEVFVTGKGEVEAEFFTRDKEKITYYFNGSSTHYDGKIYLTGMGIDITKRVEAEDAIQHLNSQLQLTIQQLQARNNDLQQFSHVVSHQLRSPLARILGLASIFNQEAADTPFIIHQIAQAATQLDDVVKEMSEVISSRDAGQKYEQVSFDEELQRAQVALEAEITSSHAEISADFSDAPGMITVRHVVSSVLYKLLSNAVKYRQKEVPLKIQLSTKKVNQYISLAITDNGTGIDLTKHGDKLFVLYKRFCDASIPGKGVGLCLVKSQVESLGGKIDVRSALNQGSTFTIYLPIEHETSGAEY